MYFLLCLLITESLNKLNEFTFIINVAYSEPKCLFISIVIDRSFGTKEWNISKINNRKDRLMREQATLNNFKYDLRSIQRNMTLIMITNGRAAVGIGTC